MYTVASVRLVLDIKSFGNVKSSDETSDLTCTPIVESGIWLWALG